MTQDNIELFSEESEKAVLSILLQYPEKFYEYLELESEMFSSVPHRIIYDAMDRLSKEGLIPEPTVLTEHLKSNKLLEEAGETTYIEYLLKRSDNPDNFKKFESIVINSYRGRSLLGIVHKIPGMVRETKDINGVIDYLRKAISDLLLLTGGDGTKSLKESLRAYWEIIKDRYYHPGIRGISTGFMDIDTRTQGMTPGDLIIIAGRPSMGKSAWMVNSALKCGEPCLLFSKEMNLVSLQDRLHSIYSGVEARRIRMGTLEDDELEALKNASIYLKDVPIYIDTNYLADINYIISTIRRFHKVHGIRVVHIDYVQLVAERNENSVHEIGSICRSLKLLANELDIVVYLYSQLNRRVEERDDKRPILSDLRQSGNLEEDADIIIMLYRDDYYNPDTKAKGLVENLLRKNRNGMTGKAKLRFHPETLRMDDTDKV